MEDSIVRDKVESIQKSAEISDKLIKELFSELRRYECKDEPAENIYLLVHTLARMLFIISHSVEMFGMTYQIKIDQNIFIDWVNTIVKETQLIVNKLND